MNVTAGSSRAEAAEIKKRAATTTGAGVARCRGADLGRLDWADLLARLGLTERD
jgi:hypothetical protein